KRKIDTPILLLTAKGEANERVEGLEIGAGMATDQDTATTEQDIETVYATYAMGSISVGYQVTDVDATAANEDIERTAYGISFAVNENMSI
mgnify:CR=1